MRFREMVLIRVTQLCEFIDPRSSWIRQPEHFGAFIERLTCRVVDGLANNGHAIIRFNLDYLGVAA